jgi:Glycosyl hydrolase family 65, N-terminal domain
MHIGSITCLLWAAVLLPCTAAEPLVIRQEPRLWPDSLPLLTAERTVLVLDREEVTQFRGFARAVPRKRCLTEPEIRAQVAGLMETLPVKEGVELKIEWLSGGKAVGFNRTVLTDEGALKSTYRVGSTTITRTMLADQEDGTIFLHLLADQPGALSFRVRLSIPGAAEPELVDRRQLVIPAGQADRTGAHVWVIPFESDVTREGNAISLMGEGEALILLTFAQGPKATSTLAGTLQRLGNRYDPGQVPADPSKIWRGVWEARVRKSVENSP